MTDIIQSIYEGTSESATLADIIEGELGFSNDSEFQKLIYRHKNEGGPATYENFISETWMAKTDSITAGGTGSGSDLMGVDNTNFLILTEDDAQSVFEEIDVLINDALAGNIAFLDVNQEFTGVNTFSNSLVVTGSFISSGLTYPSADGTSGYVMTTDGAGILSFAPLPASVESGFWDATANTQTPPPASGRIIWNNATQINSTELHIHYTTATGFPGANFIQSLQVDDQFAIGNVGDLETGQRWEIDANVDNTTYATLTVTLLSGTKQFANNSNLEVFFATQASGSLVIPGGVDGDLQFKTGSVFTGGGPNWDGTDLSPNGDIVLGSSNTIGFDNAGGLSFDSADNGIFSNNLRVTGSVISRPDSDNASSLAIAGGSSVGGQGGNLAMFGPSHASTPGDFILRDGTDNIYNYDASVGLSTLKSVQFLFKSTNTASSANTVVFSSKHENDAEENTAMIVANNPLGGTPNTLSLGGSAGSLNAVRLGAGYAAADDTTLTGTQIFTWDTNGLGVVTGNLIMNNGPTISTGSGVPATSEPNGSLFLRTDGTGPNLYVRENGVWVSK